MTSNHDLKLLRKMFAWGVRERLIRATPFKVGTASVIALDPETPRERRFASDDDETRLLRAANPHLRGILVAMLDTCCRPGDILSLQWGDGDMSSRELVVRAEKAKTRRERAGLADLHLADLRHEAALRLEDAGLPTICVLTFLGHRNLSTTTRYLNATIRGLRLAVEKLEESRRNAARKPKKSAGLANGLQTAGGSPLEARPTIA